MVQETSQVASQAAATVQATKAGQAAQSVKTRIAEHDVVLYVKGSPSETADTVTVRLLAMLGEGGHVVDIVDVGDDSDLVEAALALTDPYFPDVPLPLLFAGGQFCGDALALVSTLDGADLAQKIDEQLAASSAKA